MQGIGTGSEFNPIKPDMAQKGAPKSTGSDSSSAVNQVGLQKPADSQQTQATPKQQSWTIKLEDIKSQLLALQRPVTPDNVQVLMTMLTHGVETSEEAFNMIDRYIKGKAKGNSLESSVVAYSKGFSGNSKAINLISKFLSNQTSVAATLQNLRATLGRFQGVLSNYNQHIDPSLLAGITSMLDDYLKDIKKYNQSGERVDLKKMLSKQSGVMQDTKFLQEFLGSIEKRFLRSKNIMNKEFGKLIGNLNKEISDFHDGLLTQLVLSKNPMNNHIAEQFFHYWMVPNPLVNNKKDMELLISKDEKNKKRINPDKVKIVIKCDTNELGQLTIMIEIDEKKVFYKFYSNKQLTKEFVLNETKTLKKSMESLNYELAGVQAYAKKMDIKKLLVPVFDLDNMTRISTEA